MAWSGKPPQGLASDQLQDRDTEAARLERASSRAASRADDEDGDGSSPTSHKANVARFEGSFAPSARPESVRVKPWYADRDYFLKGWMSPSIWKAAFVEGVATGGVVYLSGQITGTIMSYNTVQVGAYIGISNIVLIATFIYATAAPTGGHINPMITFSAMISGICPIPRGILYLCGQTAGSALAGGLLFGVWGRERAAKYQGGGCFYDPATISSGQAFLNEVVSSFILLYLAYGVGLDPRQAIVFGPKLGPLLVGTALGLVSFSSSGSVPGYAGANMNPARCFAYGIARENLAGQWIWWFGPAAAAILLAIMYNLLPPHFSATPEEEKPRVPQIHERA